MPGSHSVSLGLPQAARTRHIVNSEPDFAAVLVPLGTYLPYIRRYYISC